MTEKVPEIQFTETGNGLESGERVTISVAINTGIEDSSKDLDAYINLDITANGNDVVTDALGAFKQDALVNYDTTHVFSSSGDYELRANARVSYFSDTDEVDEEEISTTTNITIGEVDFTADGRDVGDTTTENTLGDTYSEFVRFEITSVEDSDFGQSPETPIEFEYSNPSISIDTGGNFAKHEIIGGATVRQKIGDKPLEISVDGVAREETVKKLELLRNVNNATVLSSRFSKDAVVAHIVSISTDPLEDGGAAQMTTGNLLYSYSMELVEIFGEGVGSDESEASSIPANSFEEQ